MSDKPSTEKKICYSCQNEMKLKVASYPMGSAFVRDRFHVDIYCCPVCQRVALFAAESDSVVCPVCGTTHNAREKCPLCAINAAFGNHEAT